VRFLSIANFPAHSTALQLPYLAELKWQLLPNCEDGYRFSGCRLRQTVPWANNWSVQPRGLAELGAIATKKQINHRFSILKQLYLGISCALSFENVFDFV